VVKPAEAERQAMILRAEGEKQAAIIRAEATQKQLEFQGAGEAAKIAQVAKADAGRVLAGGRGGSGGHQDEALAEAEGMQRKPKPGSSSTRPPSSHDRRKDARAGAGLRDTVSSIDKINIIEMGTEAARAGSARSWARSEAGMTAMLLDAKDQFGIDVARLMQAKTDARPMRPSKKTAKR